MTALTVIGAVRSTTIVDSDHGQISTPNSLLSFEAMLAAEGIPPWQ